MQEQVLVQLGGINKLQAMAGAKNFVKGKDFLSFKFQGAKYVNYIKITLNSNDLYDLEFGKLSGLNYKIVEVVEDVFCDELIRIFEQKTGLYLNL